MKFGITKVEKAGQFMKEQVGQLANDLYNKEDIRGCEKFKVGFMQNQVDT